MNYTVREARLSSPLAEMFHQNARDSFRLAKNSTAPANRQRYMAIGADYVELAREAAKRDGVVLKTPSVW